MKRVFYSRPALKDRIDLTDSPIMSRKRSTNDRRFTTRAGAKIMDSAADGWIRHVRGAPSLVTNFAADTFGRVRPALPQPAS